MLPGQRLRFLIPLLWVTAAIMGAAASVPTLRSPPFELGPHDTYYVVAHAHWVVSLSGACLGFAGLYLLLGIAPRWRYRPSLAWAHLVFTVIGGILIFWPRFISSLVLSSRSAENLEATFRLWNLISSLGYVLTLLGAAAFAILLLEAATRRLRPMTSTV